MNAPFLDPMNATLRESRMVLERLVQWKGVEPGMIFSVMDCGVYSAALGPSGCEDLERQIALLASSPSAPISIIEAGDAIRIDAGGRHAWLIAEPALDLAIDEYRRKGAGAVTVVNAVEPAELRIVAAIAEKHELSATATAGDDGSVRIEVGARDPSRQTVLDRIRRQGIPVRRDLWFHLFHLSSNALAEDTVISRTHTGAFMIKPDGTVVGEHDEEFAHEDISMLTAEALEFRR
ncbi:hypothetical protein MesoLjLc_09270 [Mesorhizobium sp. L-8-10]|uniref:hypothetical protein n=1 Tax=Mesorhizobium sp. L-8-10 TaxID=2744523 RepID=UPI00192623B9|nr:hypothetical protein [Mesorhizobium sp. L-8-10]BCH28997.1 hypothetical protein MesoLjLc_09270 [Mesorhizobium sp. L-8-10]